MSQKKTLSAQIQMIGPVTNLFPGHLPTATVLGNYSLHAVKILLVCRLLIHLTGVLIQIRTDVNLVWFWVQLFLKVTSRPFNQSFHLGLHCLLINQLMGLSVHKGLRVKVNNETF